MLVATWRASSLARWWDDVAGELDSSPRTPGARREVEALLREPAQEVLEVLREETTPLILRVRIVAEAVREARRAERQSRAQGGGGDRRPEGAAGRSDRNDEPAENSAGGSS